MVITLACCITVTEQMYANLLNYPSCFFLIFSQLEHRSVYRSLNFVVHAITAPDKLESFYLKRCFF